VSAPARPGLFLRILRYPWSIRKSILAFVLAFGLTFVSMGYLSLALYAVVSPVLGLFYPPPDSWKGPWVWPVLVGVGLLWSFSFLPGGIINRALGNRGTSRAVRRVVYAGVLWLGALLAWLFMLYTNMPDPVGAAG
jgi:hypothetical protein